MEMKPKATSTPSMLLRVHGRQSYQDRPEIPSPVPHVRNMKNKIKETQPKEVTTTPLRMGESAQYKKPKKNIIPENNTPDDTEDEQPNIYEYIMTYKDQLSNLLLYIFVLIIIVIPNHSVTPNKSPTLHNLKLKYPNQNPQLWMYFSSGISDIIRFNKPSVIVVMYTENTEGIAEEIVKNMSVYAGNKLANSENPIIIHSSELNIDDYLQDYGKIIADFKPRLEERRVMVVKDFDKLNAKVARAFHSICDEYTPLVDRAFYIFLVKVRSYVGREVDQIGSILRTYWGELDEDVLDPLIARVTNVVLRVSPEL